MNALSEVAIAAPPTPLPAIFRNRLRSMSSRARRSTAPATRGSSCVGVVWLIGTSSRVMVIPSSVTGDQRISALCYAHLTDPTRLQGRTRGRSAREAGSVAPPTNSEVAHGGGASIDRPGRSTETVCDRPARGGRPAAFRRGTPRALRAGRRAAPGDRAGLLRRVQPLRDLD